MRVLVVGASSSVGREVVRRLLAEHAVLATCWRTPLAPAPNLEIHSLNLEAPETFQPFIDDLTATFGRPDAAILLSSLLPGKNLADYPETEIERVMAVNFTAQAMLVRLLMPVMAEHGRFILMSSVSGVRGSFDPVYAASKAALIGFTRSLAAWHGDRLRFACLVPRLIEGSAMYHAMAPERREHHRRQSSSGRLMTVEQVAATTVDLLGKSWSDADDPIIELDGG